MKLKVTTYETRSPTSRGPQVYLHDENALNVARLDVAGRDYRHDAVRTAEKIALAVNSHDDLLRELETAIAWIEDATNTDPSAPTAQELVKQLRATADGARG